MIGFLELAQTLQMAIKALQMYTPSHPRAVSTIQSLASAIQSWLQERTYLRIAATGGKIFVDGAPVEGNSLHLQALARQLSERQIAGFVIQRGVEESELLSMLQILILKPSKIEEQGGVARVMASLNLRNITLGQTQYREVREGDGDAEGTGGPALSPFDPNAQAASQAQTTPLSSSAQEAVSLAARIQSASSPLLMGIAESVRQWKTQLLAASDQLDGAESNLLAGEGIGSGTGTAIGGMNRGDRILGRIPAADLSSLAAFARESGWGEGAPSELQLEGMRKAIQELPAATRLGILKGMEASDALPGGLRQGVETLAPSVFAQATSELLAQGVAWKSLRENLFEILHVMPGEQQRMLSELQVQLRQQALDMGCIQDLFRRLEWDQASLDGRLRMVLEAGRLWDLTLAERLEFLRSLMDQGRMDPFIQILEDITHRLTMEDPQLREPAAQTLSGVACWALDPELEDGLPLDVEGLLQPALAAHFAWEPLIQIHRPTEEGLLALLASFLQRGDPPRAQTLLQELEGLCAFLEDVQAWRKESLQRLGERLSSDDMLRLAVKGLYQAEGDAVLQVFVPYFEFLGEPAAAALVRLLGDEPDRKHRARLLEIIRVLGPLAMPALQEGLHAPMWYLVRNTLNLLAEMGDASLLEDVAKSLRHGDVRVRGAAVRAVWKLGGPRSAPQLLAVFPSTDPETQMEILFGLGQIQSAAAVPVLGEFAKNAQAAPRLRLKSIETLGHIGNPAAIPFLADLIRRRGRIFTSAEPMELRLAAAHALISVGTPQALAALQELAKDEPRGQDKDALMAILASRRP